MNIIQDFASPQQGNMEYRHLLMSLFIFFAPDAEKIIEKYEKRI